MHSSYLPAVKPTLHRSFPGAGVTGQILDPHPCPVLTVLVEAALGREVNNCFCPRLGDTLSFGSALTLPEGLTLLATGNSVGPVSTDTPAPVTAAAGNREGSYRAL